MKRKLTIMLMCLMLLAGSMPVYAQSSEIIESGYCGDSLTWTIMDDGVLTILGDGDMSHYNNQQYGWIDNTIYSVIIEEGVTSIDANAFAYCLEIESVTIPNSMIKIGEFAFGCCDGLTVIEIPANVSEIAEDAFYGCSSLERFVVNEENQHYYSDESGVLCKRYRPELIAVPNTIRGSYTIPDGVEKIPENMFLSCENLYSVTIPYSVTEIDKRAFERCDNLAMVMVSEDNQFYSSDENGVLYNKDMNALEYVPGGMTELTIPDSVSWIGDWAFVDGYNLEEIKFTGNAPGLEDYDPIWWEEATVYYPENDSIWTEAVMRRFGSDITWIAFDPENDVDDASGTAEGTPDEEMSDSELQAIVFSILRGLAIGITGIAVVAGVIITVIYVRKRLDKRDEQ